MAKPMQHLMEWLASHMGNNYGWAIIVIVVVVRTILLPVMFSQMKKSTIMQEKMSKVQPLIKELTEKQKAA
jgi:YidC/Oxa1 family membrane protein insertase